MPKPDKFRCDVVAVTRMYDSQQSQTPHEFKIIEATLDNWLRKADVDNGVRLGVTTVEAEVLRALDRRDRLSVRALEQDAGPGFGGLTSTSVSIFSLMSTLQPLSG